MTDWKPVEFVPNSIVTDIERSATAYFALLRQKLPDLPDIAVSATADAMWQSAKEPVWVKVGRQLWLPNQSAGLKAINAWFGSGGRRLTAGSAGWPIFASALAKCLLPDSMKAGWVGDEAMPNAWVHLTVSGNAESFEVVIGSGIWAVALASSQAPAVAPKTVTMSSLAGKKSVEISAEIPSIPVSFSELLSLTVGDLLLVDANAFSSVRLSVSGEEALFSGQLGRCNQNLGVKVG